MKLFLAFTLFLLSWNSSSYAQLNNCRVLTQTLFGATTVSVIGLVQNSNRRCLMIQNTSNGTTTIFIKFGSAHSASEGIALTAGTMWAPIIVPMNSIYIKSSGNGANGTSTMLIQGE